MSVLTLLLAGPLQAWGASARFTRRTSSRRPPVSLVTVTFDGHLEVTDPHLLRRALTQGIGKAKAYGCGLLTLAPLPTAR